MGRSLAVFVTAALIMIGIVVGVRSSRVAKRQQAAQEYVMEVLALSQDEVLARATEAGIRIDGDEVFRLQIARALAVIKHNSPLSFEVITNNIRAIQPGPYTWTWPQMNPPTCIFEKTNAGYSATWTASLLVRESLHAELYHQFQGHYPTLTVPLSAWRSWKLQKKCMESVLNVMPELGASKRELEYMTLYYEKWYPEKQQDAPEPPMPQNQ